MSHPSHPSHPPADDTLLTARSALIFLIGILAGLVVGVLSYIAYRNVATAVLAGLTATASGVAFSNKLVGREASSNR